MNPKLYLCSPHMGGTEQKYVNEAFDTNWVSPLGPNVDNFENIGTTTNLMEACNLATKKDDVFRAII